MEASPEVKTSVLLRRMQRRQQEDKELIWSLPEDVNAGVSNMHHKDLIERTISLESGHYRFSLAIWNSADMEMQNVGHPQRASVAIKLNVSSEQRVAKQGEKEVLHYQKTISLLPALRRGDSAEVEQCFSISHDAVPARITIKLQGRLKCLSSKVRKGYHFDIVASLERSVAPFLPSTVEKHSSGSSGSSKSLDFYCEFVTKSGTSEMRKVRVKKSEKKWQTIKALIAIKYGWDASKILNEFVVKYKDKSDRLLTLDGDEDWKDFLTDSTRTLSLFIHPNTSLYKAMTPNVHDALSDQVKNFADFDTFDWESVDDKGVIHPNDLVLGKFLGGGISGKVYQATWKGSTADVAVKLLDRTAVRGEGKNEVRHFLKEAGLLRMIPPHPNVILFWGVTHLNNTLCLVTEFMANGNLKNYLRDHSWLLNLSAILEFATGIAAGMEHLEQQGIVHRDLAARNVLVQEKKVGGKKVIEVKICDFGMSKLLGSDQKGHRDIYEVTPGRGDFAPARWTAPEGNFQNIYSPKSDVWSFGMVLYELVTFGKDPFAGLTAREAMEEIWKGVVPEKPNDCPDYLYELMQQCWQKEKENRPTFKQITEVLRRHLEEERKEEEETESSTTSDDEGSTVSDEEFIF